MEGAILCGVDLEGAQLQQAVLSKAQLQGANLFQAQLQGAKLSKAQLQGAKLMQAQLQGAFLGGAQLQGADLWEAQLQGADLGDAELRGASLGGAQLQGANLEGAQLQGADLSGATLSVLPKGTFLPKPDAPGETEATKKDWPTNLKGANLSVLPTGYPYCDGRGVEESDAARPTNLTGARLDNATFTGATLKDATFKDAKFASLPPPERPALGALHGSWRWKALLGSVVRGAIAAADDDGNDSDDGSDDDDEEESLVKAQTEKALDTVMDRLAGAAKPFIHTVDGMFGKVEALLRSELDADHTLAELLCTKLETATDKQAAIFQTLSTHVISPVFEQHLPQVLKDARSKLLKPTDDGQAGAALVEQLLDAFTERALGAGKVALLKRLSLIVSKAVGAGYSYPKPRPN